MEHTNENRIKNVLARQKQFLGMDTLVALVVALGLFVAIVGLRTASHTALPTASAQSSHSAAVAVAADLRGAHTECMPSANSPC